MEENFRVGIGQDSHRVKLKIKKEKFKTTKKKEKWKEGLFLGGVPIDKDYLICANSDGDVVLHALFNALSSAIGQPSIGVYADKMYLKQGTTDSREYLKFIMGEVKKAGFRVNNVSLAVEAQKPRLSLKVINKMRQKIAELLAITNDCVGLTFTSGEDLTSFGRGEGIQVLALATLIKKKNA